MLVVYYDYTVYCIVSSAVIHVNFNERDGEADRQRERELGL